MGEVEYEQSAIVIHHHGDFRRRHRRNIRESRILVGFSPQDTRYYYGIPLIFDSIHMNRLSPK